MWKTIDFGRPAAIAKASPAASAALKKLRGFLDQAEPRVVYFLVSLWRSEERAITYKELREAILDGDLPPTVLEDWQQDYSRFVVDHMLPAWEAAIQTAAAEIEKAHGGFIFKPMGAGVLEWTASRAAQFVTNSTEEQVKAVRALVQRAAQLEGRSVDALARAIRPTVGLTIQQSTANFNYYNRLIENGVKEKKALDLSIQYAGRQHRYRGYNIARTELAFAYNQGSYQGVRQAQEQGYMGAVQKVWCTAEDERVCPVCGGMDGLVIGLEADFPFQTRIATPDNPTVRKVPPAHPSCRCTVGRLSSKCNTFFSFKYFFRGFPAQTFSGTVIDEVNHLLELLVR